MKPSTDQIVKAHGFTWMLGSETTATAVCKVCGETISTMADTDYKNKIIEHAKKHGVRAQTPHA